MNRLARWWQNMGFGIQSPTDFAFLHDVIREKLPYYAYADIESRYPHATQRELRVRKLIFRVRNAFTHEKVVVIDHDDTTLPPRDARAVMLIGLQLDQSALWQEMLSLRHIITFDMQDIGIAIYDAERDAQHYKILPI